MTETKSFIDLLSTNLAHVFHRYLFVKNKQFCSHQLTNSRKKIRINMDKYGHLFSSCFNQELNNKIQLNDNKSREKNNVSKNNKKKMNKSNKKKTKIKSKNTSTRRKSKEKILKTINKPPSVSIVTNQIKSQLSRDSISKREDHQSFEMRHVLSSTSLTISQTSNPTQETDSTSYLSNQYQEKMKYLYNMKPIVNKNSLNELNLTNNFQHKKMKQYSKGLKPEQLFRRPKDSRSKRRKCCGVYYELFDDAWRLLEGWFTME
ncbi:unnamed protein product [Adineta steineri]|uniref:Uncharacterized protein n=1 Tax=Adineta steineri TaxID=433720 RepID=A0A814BJ37_9BILA|nr:unnamed protein product [Adineta steineri]CAF0929118.1 unnamed protein product [Adineta steineri]